MKKALSVLLSLAIIATLLSAMFITASAETTIEVNRLTVTATNLKLADDNMSEADAIAACTARLGSEVSTYAIYSKTADGKYNYLSCAMNTGWYKAGTATLEEIVAKGGIYGVMFVGTFEDKCQPVDGITEVKAAGAEASTFSFPNKIHVCSEDELAYVQNEMNEMYKGQSNIIALELYYNENDKQIEVMKFEKMYTDKDFVAMGVYGKCETFAEYVELNSQYVNTTAKYVVPYVISFEMLDGKDQAIDLTKVETVSFRSAGELSSFVGFMIDGKYVDPSNYTVKEGSTIVEVKKSYLNTLSNGTHTVTIASQEGMATTEFTLSGATGEAASDNTGESPKTGDDSNIVLLISLMACFIGAVVLSRKSIKVR